MSQPATKADLQEALDRMEIIIMRRLLGMTFYTVGLTSAAVFLLMLYFRA